MTTPLIRPRTWAFAALFAFLLVAGTSCAAATEFVEENQGTQIDLSGLEDIDFNSPNFTVPDIVAPSIEINITEAPDFPEIRFPEAVIINLPEITSPEITVFETPDETIYTIEGQVLFDFDRADLRPEALTKMHEILAAIESRDYNGTVEVAGHTDSVGTAEYNHDLSVRRATGVALWFRERLPAEQDVQAVGYGESQPIAPNNHPDGSPDEVGQTQNRRVEIIVSR